MERCIAGTHNRPGCALSKNPHRLAYRSVYGDVYGFYHWVELRFEQVNFLNLPVLKLTPMNPFTVPTHDEVADEARPAFDRFIKLTGKMPNLYATIGYSANALNSYLQYVT